MSLTFTIAGLAVLAALIWILMRMRSTDLLEEKMARRRSSSRLVSRADLVEGSERIPVAQAKRGHLNRGPITELSIDLNGRSFRARFKNDLLELAPPVQLAAWVDLLLTRLSDAATSDHNLRRAVLRSGWALR